MSCLTEQQIVNARWRAADVVPVDDVAPHADVVPVDDVAPHVSAINNTSVLQLNGTLQSVAQNDPATSTSSAQHPRAAGDAAGQADPAASSDPNQESRGSAPQPPGAGEQSTRSQTSAGAAAGAERSHPAAVLFPDITKHAAREVEDSRKEMHLASTDGKVQVRLLAHRKLVQISWLALCGDGRSVRTEQDASTTTIGTRFCFADGEGCEHDDHRYEVLFCGWSRMPARRPLVGPEEMRSIYVGWNQNCATKAFKSNQGVVFNHQRVTQTAI